MNTIRRRRFKRGKLMSKKEKIVFTVVFILLLAYAFSLIYPFTFLILNSFKSFQGFNEDQMGFNNFVGFNNYIEVFTGYSVMTTSGEEVGVLEMFWNSLSLSVVQTVVSMFFTCCASYVLARFRFFGSKFLYSFIIVSSIIPTIAAISATYQFMTDVKLIGTFIGMVLLECGAFGGGFLYIHSYFKNIPWSFAESAMIDGAGDFKIFSRIMVPMAKNGILTFTILRFLGAWNSYWLPRLFYEDNPTLAVGLYKMSSIADNTGQHTVYFAAMIISIVPILIFYALFQKQLLSNTVDGGLK